MAARIETQSYSLSRLNARLFQALAVFVGRFFRIVFAGAVFGEVPKFVGHPVTEPFLAHVAVAVDEGGSTGQVCEHGAGVAGRHWR